MCRVSSRSPRFSLLVSVALLLTSLPELAAAADITWTNTAGGNWSNAANWNSGAGPVPGPGDIAHITTDGTYTVTLDVDATVEGLVLGAANGQQTLKLEGPGTGGSFRALTLNGASTMSANGRLWFAGGARVEGAGSLAMGGSIYNLYGTYISVPMTTTASSVMTLDAGSLVMSNGFTNYGLIELTSITAPYLEPMLEVMGTLVNAPGATIVARSGLGPYSDRRLRAVLDNQGALIVEGQNPDGAIPLMSLWNHAVDSDNLNSGVITVDGNLTVLLPGGPVSKTFTNTGTITVAAGRTFRVDQGVLHQNAVIGGPGAIALTGSVTANFNTPVTIAALIMSGSAAVLTSDLSTATTSLTMVNSSLHGAVTVTNAPGATTTLLGSTIHTKLHNAGTLIAGATINGEFTTASGSVLRLDPSEVLNVGSGFANLGTIEISRNAQIVLASGTLVNAPGAILKTQDTDGDMAYVVARLDNQGTLNVNSKLTLDKPQARHLNSGSIHVSGANFISRQFAEGSFTNSGTITVAAGRKYQSTEGTFTNAPTGQLHGAGTYDFGATLVNQGTIAPGASPGILSISGDAAFSNGTLDIELGGLTAGTQYDRLAASGVATLDGKLRVTLLDGFCAGPGDAFRVLEAGSRTGTFSSIEILGHGNPVFDVQYDGTGVTLTTQSNQLTVSTSAGPGGSISPNGVVPAACGSDPVFTMIPNAGFEVANVLVDGNSVGSVTSFTFSDIFDDHTIAASFVDAAAPVVHVVSPNGGETVYGSVATKIRWTAVDNVSVDSVQVEYSLNGANGPWTTILRSGTPTDSVAWTPPEQCSNIALIRVTSKDPTHNAGTDVSDAVFNVVCGVADVGADRAEVLALQVPNPAGLGPIRLRVSLPTAGTATVEVMAVTGQRVWSAQVSGSAGMHEVIWNGERQAPGVYFARLVAPYGSRKVRFVVLR